MNRENYESGRHSAPTSPSAPGATPPNSAAFLKRQQAEAHVAIRTTVRELKRDLFAAVDPKTWVKLSPWGTIGAAAFSGFAAAAVIVPGRQPSVATAEPAPTAPAAAVAPPPAKASGAIWAAVSTGLYGLARLMLTEVISSAMQPEPMPPSRELEPDPDLSAV